ncbi:hypothetical protein [Sandaracinus amylolyticus]|uniref:hypothetical protein n=1 Tax=Sandaracinus amylolyticus TaxID=927083 RepID=UPI001F367915|nr:hypothetical protein [Sandaracinus amylolyticus]UJR82438.1 Hypothetical protein I5071_45030 [Sandaracinus amylolyticus]
MCRSRSVCVALAIALLLLLPIPGARADFRVYEENAPGSTPPVVASEPAPAETPSEPAAPRTELRCTVCDGATCEAAAPTCAEGEQASVVDGCWSACVPVAQCGRCEIYLVETPPEPIDQPVMPEPAPAAPVAAAPQGDHRWLDLTGFVQPGFIYREDGGEEVSRPPQDDAFYLQRARFGLRTQLAWWLRARLEVELVPSPNLQDGFVDLALHPAFNVRGGQFIVPFLRAFSFNEVNLAFLDRPLYTPLGQDRTVVRYLAPRDIGAMVFGMVGDPSPGSHDPVFEYALGAFVGRGPNVAVNSDGVLLWALRLQLHVLGVPEGASAESDLARNETPRVSVATAAYSNCDDRGNWNRGFTVDTEFRFIGLYASAGFVWFRNGRADSDGLGFLAGGGDNAQCQGAVRIPDPSNPSEQLPLDFVSRGAHLQIHYTIPEIDVDILRDMDLELLARVDWVDPFAIYSDSDPLFGTGPEAATFQPSDYVDSDNGYDRWRLTFGLNYFPTGHQTLRIGLNYFLQYELERVVASTGTYRGIKNDVLWLQLTAAL